MCALCRSLLAYNSYIPTYTMALLIHHPIIRHPHEKNSITVHIINFYSLSISTIIYPDSLMGAFVQHGSINFSIARYIYIENESELCARCNPYRCRFFVGNRPNLHPSPRLNWIPLHGSIVSLFLLNIYKQRKKLREKKKRNWKEKIRSIASKERKNGEFSCVHRGEKRFHMTKRCPISFVSNGTRKHRGWPKFFSWPCCPFGSPPWNKYGL